MSVFQSEVDGKISISLDAWTSSNNFAFMAIIAHYVTTEGVLGMHFVFVASLPLLTHLQRNYLSISANSRVRTQA